MNKTVLILLLGGALTACVTINIYFPAAAAQEVADEIIDDVWQLKEGEEGKASESKNETESIDTETKTTESQ